MNIRPLLLMKIFLRSLDWCFMCRYLAITSVDETSGWYGGTLLYDQDENSEAYKHYAALCQVNSHVLEVTLKGVWFRWADPDLVFVYCLFPSAV